MAADVISLSLMVDASELERDLEAIERGEIELPTVSAVMVCVDGREVEEFPVWLPEG